MQKLVYIIMIFVVTACHKEIAQTTEINDNPVLVLALKKVMSATEFRQLDLYQMEPVEVNQKLVGYKIPFEGNTDTHCAFAFINMHEHSIGNIYKNEITYVPLFGGMYPLVISNHNYKTGITTNYHSGLAIQDSGKGGLLSNTNTNEIDNQLASLPAVTSSAVYAKLNDKTETLSSINTYILCALLGIESLAHPQQKSSWSTVKCVHYFNPRSSGSLPQQASSAWLAWDLESR